MKKWFTITIALILFVGILFSGMAIFEYTKPSPPTKGFYKNNLNLEYIIEWQVMSKTGRISGRGIITLKVINNNIILNATLPDFYPDGRTLYHKAILNLSGDNITYKGEKVILPFFHSKGKIVSYYKGNFVNVTSRSEEIATLQGGIIRFQPVYYLYSEQSIILTSNGNISHQKAPATYEYGKNTNLLFFINSPIGWDPVIDILLNLTYPEKAPNGYVLYVPINFGLSLHKTNINLGPINYFGVILTFIVLALPAIIVIGIPLTIIGIYKAMKNRRRDSK